MKKLLSLILAFILCLSLCACGNKTATTEPATTAATEATEPPTEADPFGFLTEGTWGSVFTGKAKLKFAEDGTGTYSQQDMTWELWDNQVIFYYSSTGYYGETSASEVECDIIEYNGIKMLMSDGTIYVPAANFSEGCAAAKEYMLNSAKELDWSAAYNLSLQNEVKANQEYNGIVKWTATVYDIDTVSCQMADELGSTGLPLNSIMVSMSEEELAKLNKGQSYTIVGFLSVSSRWIGSAFIVE